jgi:hypothetical protein
MNADLWMLADTFLRYRSLSSHLLIKTHPQQVPAVHVFINQYTLAHPSVDIAVKATPYLCRGEYEMHIVPNFAQDNADLLCVPQRAAA